jgi:hypothetical protein
MLTACCLVALLAAGCGSDPSKDTATSPRKEASSAKKPEEGKVATKDTSST